MKNILKVKIKDEIYAFDAERIEQILTPPFITPVPLSAKHILGIASIGGKIVRVIDMKELLYNSKISFNDNTKLLTMFGGDGFVVDEVLEMTEIDENQFEQSDNDLLEGIYKENKNIIQIINIDKVLSLNSILEFKPKTLSHINPKDENKIVVNESYKRVLFFKVNGEKFAVDIDILREIIYPPAITPVATSDSLGVITLRGEAINVLSINKILGFRNKKIDEKSRILIASDSKRVVGLLVDEVEEVKNIEVTQIEKLPNSDEIVEAVYKKDMVTLLSNFYIRKLIDNYYVEDEEEKKETLKENIVSEVAVFRIDNEEYAFDIDEVQEIIKYEEITPIPDVPDIVEGILNLRGAVIPVISLAKRLDLKENITDKTKIIVCDLDGDKIGFIVDDVSEILFVEDKYVSKAQSEEAIFDEVIDINDRIILKIKVKNLLDKESLEKIKIRAKNGEESIDS